jgi:hypothetical protein
LEKKKYFDKNELTKTTRFAPPKKTTPFRKNVVNTVREISTMILISHYKPEKQTK